MAPVATPNALILGGPPSSGGTGHGWLVVASVGSIGVLGGAAFLVFVLAGRRRNELEPLARGEDLLPYDD